MNVSVKSNLTGKQKRKNGKFHIVYFEEVLGALHLLLSALTHFPL